MKKFFANIKSKLASMKNKTVISVKKERSAYDDFTSGNTGDAD